MRYNKERVFGSDLAEIKKEMREVRTSLTLLERRYEKKKEEMDKLTPEYIIEQLRDSERRWAFAILSVLAQNLGELTTLNQIMGILYENFDEKELFYEDAVKAVKDKWGKCYTDIDDSVVNELCKIFLGKNSYVEIESEAEIETIHYIRSCTLTVAGAEIFGKEITDYINYGVITKSLLPDYNEDTVAVTFIDENNLIWLAYDALLDNKEARDEGVALLKRVKMEMALEGHKIKFSEGEQ